jgi:PIN domain nuclease of toxin-antitoxin system
VSALLADTHALLWMLKGSLRERSARAADALEQALIDQAVHVSIGSFLDLRYLVDSGRLSADVFEHVRSIVDGEDFTVVPFDLSILDAMAVVSREQVPDPFDRIIAATALRLDLPLVTVDESIQRAIGERAVW